MKIPSLFHPECLWPSGIMFILMGNYSENFKRYWELHSPPLGHPPIAIDTRNRYYNPIAKRRGVSQMSLQKNKKTYIIKYGFVELN
jgi:hypothetical protein